MFLVAISCVVVDLLGPLVLSPREIGERREDAPQIFVAGYPEDSAGVLPRLVDDRNESRGGLQRLRRLVGCEISQVRDE